VNFYVQFQASSYRFCAFFSLQQIHNDGKLPECWMDGCNNDERWDLFMKSQEGEKDKKAGWLVSFPLLVVYLIQLN
jgi:hypothetical protein